jgi:hypothetical protein
MASLSSGYVNIHDCSVIFYGTNYVEFTTSMFLCAVWLQDVLDHWRGPMSAACGCSCGSYIAPHALYAKFYYLGLNSFRNVTCGTCSCCRSVRAWDLTSSFRILCLGTGGSTPSSSGARGWHYYTKLRVCNGLKFLIWVLAEHKRQARLWGFFRVENWAGKSSEKKGKERKVSKP